VVNLESESAGASRARPLATDNAEILVNNEVLPNTQRNMVVTCALRESSLFCGDKGHRAGDKAMVRNQQQNESLDRLGQIVLRSAAQNDEASQAAADAPFLYTRVRARIAELSGRNESGIWSSLLLIARRAIPAMALIALLAATCMFWASRSTVTPGWNRLDDEALVDTGNPGLEQTILSRNNLSNEDVFNIVLEHHERRSDK
jgi:hypothetical protein